MILKYTCMKYLSAIFFSIHILLRFFSAHQKPPCCCVFRRTNPILPRTTSPYCQQRQFKANLVDFLFKGHVINNFQTKQAAYDAGLDVASATRIVMGWVGSAKIWVVYEIRVLYIQQQYLKSGKQFTNFGNLKALKIKIYICKIVLIV